jgi:hypothetical protein
MRRHILRTQNVILERAKIVTKSGRVHYAHNQETLDALPPDIVQELARRTLADLAEGKRLKAAAAAPKG